MTSLINSIIKLMIKAIINSIKKVFIKDLDISLDYSDIYGVGLVDPIEGKAGCISFFMKDNFIYYMYFSSLYYDYYKSMHKEMTSKFK